MLDYSYYYPAEAAWEEGDRVLLCYSYPMEHEHSDDEYNEDGDDFGTDTALRHI